MKSRLVKLGKLCKIQSGGTPRRGVDGFYGGNIPWAKIGDIENAQNGYLFNTVEKITIAGLKSINNKIFPPNTILLAMYGSVGKTSIVGLEMATNQAILGLQPNNQDILYFKYLRYWLDYSKSTLVSKARGVALQNISATIVKEFEIPLIPIENQKRIVEILDQVDALRQKRKQAIDLLDDYLRSVFLEMFGDPVNNPKGWKTKKIGEMIDFMTSGSRGWAKYYAESGDVFLRIQNVGKNNLLLNDICYVEPPRTAESLRTKVQTGDILLSITADLGRTAVIPDKFANSYISQHLALLRLKKEFLPEYVAEFLSSRGGGIQIERLNKGGTKAGLNFNDVRSLHIPQPAKDLQSKYLDVRTKLLSLKQKMIVQSEELENKFQVLVQKAFKGEL